MKRIFFFILFTIPLAHFCNGQITVDNTVSPEDAMQTLLGENVTISNLQFSGIDHQIGVFDCDDCGLDFSSGVILATGDVESALGPNTGGATEIGGNQTDFPELITPDDDLSILNPGFDFHDLVVLEFDFVALGDSVWFDYVWASDEYPEWSTSNFNDTFGFFISGPGINGPYSNNAENIAIIPGTDLGVTMNNINNGNANNGPCSNCEFYESNGTGSSDDPQFTDPTVVGYDGYTIGLRATKGDLVCGETYHLKIATTDVGDEAYDSAVFLKSGSLSSNLTVEVQLEIQATTEDGIMNEECGLSTLIFIRPEAISSDLEFVVEVAYEGDAVNGVDYTAIPENIIFDPGVDTISFVLDAFEDMEIEGLESVQLIMQNLAVCQGAAVPSFFEFFITESSPLDIDGYDQLICDGGTTTLEPIINGGSGGFEYEWSTSETTSTIDVSPTVLTTYSVEVSDTCLASVSNASFEVDVAAYPPLTISANPSTLDIDCNWFGEFFNSSAGGGDGNYTFNWLDEDGNILGSGQNFDTFDNSLTSLIAQVTDGCGIQTQQVITITNDITPLEIQVPDSIYTCPGLDFEVTPVITGEDPFNLSWFNSQTFEFFGNDATLTMSTEQEFELLLSVNDQCFQFQEVAIQVAFASPVPLLIDAGPDQIAECEDEITFTGNVSSGIAPYSYAWSSPEGVFSNSSNALYTVDDPVMITLTVNDACGSETSDQLEVSMNQIPLEIYVPENLTGDCLTEFQITATTNQPDDVTLFWTGPAQMNEVDNYNVTYQSYNSGTIQVSGDAGCSNIDSEVVEIEVFSPELDINTSSSQNICLGESAIISATASGGSGDYSYFLDEVAQSVSYTEVEPIFTTTYEWSVQDQCQNYATDEVQVNVEQLEVGVIYNALEFNTYEFTPGTIPACEGCTFEWVFNDGTTSNENYPVHTFSSFDGFGAELFVTTESDCVFSDSISVVIPLVYVPNSFTPNGDGLNDVFKVESRGLTGYFLQVFNRWGEVVYESNNPSHVWDGSKLGGDYFVSNGVYSYVLKYKSGDTQAKELSGSISVFR